MTEQRKVVEITDAPSMKEARERFSDLKKLLLEKASRLKKMSDWRDYCKEDGYRVNMEKSPEHILRILGKDKMEGAESGLEIDFGECKGSFNDPRGTTYKKELEGKRKEILSFLKDGSVIFYQALETKVGRQKMPLEGTCIYAPEDTSQDEVLKEQYAEFPKNKEKVIEAMKNFNEIIDQIIARLEDKSPQNF